LPGSASGKSGLRSETPST